MSQERTNQIIIGWSCLGCKVPISYPKSIIFFRKTGSFCFCVFRADKEIMLFVGTMRITRRSRTCASKILLPAFWRIKCPCKKHCLELLKECWSVLEDHCEAITPKMYLLLSRKEDRQKKDGDNKSEEKGESLNSSLQGFVEALLHLVIEKAHKEPCLHCSSMDLQWLHLDCGMLAFTPFCTGCIKACYSWFMVKIYREKATVIYIKIKAENFKCHINYYTNPSDAKKPTQLKGALCITELKCGLLKLSVKKQIDGCECIGSDMPLTSNFQAKHLRTWKNVMDLTENMKSIT